MLITCFLLTRSAYRPTYDDYHIASTPFSPPITLKFCVRYRAPVVERTDAQKLVSVGIGKLRAQSMKNQIEGGELNEYRRPKTTAPVLNLLSEGYTSLGIEFTTGMAFNALQGWYDWIEYRVPPHFETPVVYIDVFGAIVGVMTIVK